MMNGRAGTGVDDALAPTETVCVVDGLADRRVRRRTVLLHVSAMIHAPIPSGPIDGLLKSALVAGPASPVVPVSPAVPATVDKMPEDDT